MGLVAYAKNLGRSGNLAVKFLIEVFADFAKWQLHFLHLANIVSSYISYRGQYKGKSKVIEVKNAKFFKDQVLCKYKEI